LRQAGGPPCFAKAIFLPNLVEPLPLPFVVAENVNRVGLAQPAMQLREKFAALCLGNLRLRRAIAQRTKRVERGKQKRRGLWVACLRRGTKWRGRQAGCGLLRTGADCARVDRLDDSTSWI